MSPDSRELLLSIDGMTCGHCKATVEKTLAALPDIGEYAVDLGAGRARVVLRDGAGGAEAIAEAVTRAGYPAMLVDA